MKNIMILLVLGLLLTPFVIGWMPVWSSWFGGFGSMSPMDRELTSDLHMTDADWKECYQHEASEFIRNGGLVWGPGIVGVAEVVIVGGILIFYFLVCVAINPKNSPIIRIVAGAAAVGMAKKVWDNV